MFTDNNIFNTEYLMNEQLKLMQQALAAPIHSAISRRVSSPITSNVNYESHRKIERCLSDSSNNVTNVNSSRYKTELCRPFEESGVCNYGDKCQFAHGAHELRTLTRHPKYKTELCRTFHNTAYCPYGLRCHFVHNDDERVRPNSYQTGTSTTSSPMSMSPTSQVSFFSEGSLSPSSDSARTSPSPSFNIFNTGFPTLTFEQFRPTAI